MLRRAFVAGALALCTTGTSLAQPGTDPERTAAAQALFDRAVALMEQGSFEQACSKLAEVVRLEPRGVGAQLKLAECHEGAGRLASAWTLYVVVESEAARRGQKHRSDWAKQRAAALKPRLSTLTIRVPQTLRGLSGLQIVRDHISVGAAQFGVPVPVDGGSHEVVVTAPGKKQWRTTLTVKTEADAQVVEVPTLANEETAKTAPLRARATRLPQRHPPPSDSGSGTANAGRGPEPWAIGAGIAGAALLATGIAFRVDGKLVEDRQKDACGADRKSCPRDFDVDGTNARKERDFYLFVGLSTAGVLALGASAAGLLLSQDSSQPLQASVWLTPAGRPGAGFHGRF